jgi:hypothetical protein
MKQYMGYGWAKYKDIKLEICEYNNGRMAIQHEKGSYLNSYPIKMLCRNVEHFYINTRNHLISILKNNYLNDKNYAIFCPYF